MSYLKPLYEGLCPDTVWSCAGLRQRLHGIIHENFNAIPSSTSVSSQRMKRGGMIECPSVLRRLDYCVEPVHLPREYETTPTERTGDCDPA